MKEEHECVECGKTALADPADPGECCGKPMVKKQVELEPCTNPPGHETTRPGDDEDACDDGRAGT